MAVVRPSAPSILLVVAALAGCSAPRRQAAWAPGPVASASPVAEAKAESRPVSAEFLDRYDRDRDGRVTRAEHARTGEAFENLDRDRDGIITAADFRQAVSMPVDLAAPFIIVRRFAGPDADSIGVGDLDDAFATADADQDGAVDRAEFLGPEPPPGPDRFAPVLSAADSDRDGKLLLAELKGYALRRDRDGDGRLSRRERMKPGVEPSIGFIEPGKREPAPDFMLPREDGAGTVTLSAFAGKRPVALIFGSFT